jgi:S-adenosylmethionine synthetase
VRTRTYGSGKIDDAEIARRLMRVFDFRVGAIVRDLRLRHLPSERKRGFYRRLACCGHMGRVDLEAPWEALDHLEALRD